LSKRFKQQAAIIQTIFKAIVEGVELFLPNNDAIQSQQSSTSGQTPIQPFSVLIKLFASFWAKSFSF
jgi:hypothetical protein